MSVYKLRGAATGGTEDGIAALDIQFDGEIVAILGAMDGDLDADAETIACEVSFLSGNTTAINDTRGSLFMMRIRNAETSAVGNMPVAVNNAVSSLRIPVSAGERIFMHVIATAGVVSTSNVYIYVNDGTPADLRRRR